MGIRRAIEGLHLAASFQGKITIQRIQITQVCLDCICQPALTPTLKLNSSVLTVKLFTRYGILLHVIKRPVFFLFVCNFVSDSQAAEGTC